MQVLYDLSHTFSSQPETQNSRKESPSGPQKQPTITFVGILH
jgi:hypothetical protein